MLVHPADQLTTEEILSAAGAVRSFWAAERLPNQPRFNTITLLEPSRHELLDFDKGGVRPARAAHVICTQQKKRNPLEFNVDLSESLAKVVFTETPEGVASFIFEDLEDIQAAMKASSELQALVKQYGLQMEHITIDPWPIQASSSDIPTQERWAAGFIYYQPLQNGNYYAHPLPWMPVLDCSTFKVVRIDNAHKAPPPLNKLASQYRASMLQEPPRTDLKPLLVSQPKGASFEVDGTAVRWQRWHFRVGFNYREGLVLHGISYEDSGRQRPVLYRASVAEMCVPYGDPQPPFNRKLAFDAGDVGLGLATNSLELGCDCLGTVHYFDGIVNDCKGSPVVIKNAICVHEEDDGMSWKHTDFHTEHTEVRRGRRLVVQFIATLANYEYAFAWHFKTDASISFEAKLTGIVSTHTPSPQDGEDPRFGSLVLPHVVAPFHQHLFCTRLDWACDDDSAGDDLAVTEVDVELLPEEENAIGNAFIKRETELSNESMAQRLADSSKSRFWMVKNCSKTNAYSGQPIAWKVVPPNTQTLLGLPGSTTQTRAGFAAKNLWVTPYSPKERWPGGKYTLQNPNPGGLLEWTKQDRRIKQPVMWHVFGATHIPRPEDFPVMPVEVVGFHMRPAGFFLKNPAIDLPVTKDLSSKLFSGDANGMHSCLHELSVGPESPAMCNGTC